MTASRSQHDRWNDWHSRMIADDPEPFHYIFRENFLHEVRQRGAKGRVLELGCGQGADSIFLANAGCFVDGVDFSANAIERAVAKSEELGVDVTFSCRDLEKPLPYTDDEFDGVFSYLSLHYFDRRATTRLFHEIGRVLVLGGVLAFCVRSVKDPMYARGTRLEHNMFCNNGHIRHFFSEEDVASLLTKWNIVEIGRRNIQYLDETRPLGDIVHAIAIKTPAPGCEKFHK